MKRCVFYARNKKTGEEFSFTLEDLYGYEGEVNGVIIKGKGVLSYNSGYGFYGMNPELDIYDIKVLE